MQAQKIVPSHQFLLLGQSNMAGRATLLEQDSQPIHNTYVCDHFGCWLPAVQPLNRYSSIRKSLDLQGYCLGGTFASELLASGQIETVGLIANAMGGSRIESWQPPNEPLYQITIARWIDAGRPQLAGVLWHQGENNETDQQYYDKVVKLFSELRKQLRQPELPIVLGHITPGDVINPQIEAAARSLGRCAVVPVCNLSTFDEVHYDRDSTIELGRRYAKAYLSLTTPT